MKRKSIILLVTLAAIVSLVLVGCAPKAAPPGEAPPEEVAPPETEEEEAPPEVAPGIELVVGAHVTPKYHDIIPLAQAFIDDVNGLGAGRVSLDFYHSGTLLKVKELIPGLEAGTADIIFLTTSHCTGSWPIMGGESLPFLYKSDYDLERRFRIGAPLFNFVSEVMEEQHGIVFLANGLLPLEYIWTNKPVKTPKDMEGLKLRVAGEIEGKAVEALGGSAVFMPSAELYEALQRGTVDGAVIYAGGIGGRSLQEVIKYCTKVPIGAYGYALWIKKDTWDGLPEDVRLLIQMAAIKYDYRYLDYAKTVHEEEYWSTLFKDAGIEVIELSPEVVEEFREKCEPVWDAWVDDIGAEIGNKFIELATE